MLEVLNVSEVKEMLLYVADKIIRSKSYLTEADSAIGDGDHGIGMSQGMGKVIEKITKRQDYDNVYEIFQDAGKAMMMSMGGASGIIFGSLYFAGAKNQEPKKVLSAYDFACMERRSLKAIQERGKASPGDKTMVDALNPAVEAMEGSFGMGLLEMLKKAEKAAFSGMESTKEMTAKFGRAKSLMERAKGYQDAGAASVFLIFQGMREYVEMLEEKGGMNL